MRIALVLIMVAAIGLAAYGDSTLWRFYNDLSDSYVIWGAKGQYYDSDTKTWESGWKRCTTAILWATDEYLYGIVSEHCTVSTVTFRLEGLYIVRRSGDKGEKVKAEILSYMPAEELSEVRLWRAPNVWKIPRTATQLKTSWDVGEDIFYCSFWPTTVYYNKACWTGITAAPGPSEPYRSVLTDEVLGNMIFQGPTYWGFSGSPVFMWEDGWKLVGVVNGFSIFSNISMAWGVDPSLGAYISREISMPAPSQEPKQTIEAKHYPANYEQWDDEAKAHWQKALERNSSYELDYESGVGFYVTVDGRRYDFDDSLVVLQAITNNKITKVGAMLSVAWHEFSITPRRK